jgi:hypothetical protein
MCHHYADSLTILLLEDDLGLSCAYFSLAVQPVQVEAIGIGTIVSSQEVRAILGSPEGHLQGAICQFIPVQ